MMLKTVVDPSKRGEGSGRKKGKEDVRVGARIPNECNCHMDSLW
jgi:hypothetical protein